MLEKGKKVLRGNLRQYSMIIALVLITGLFGIITKGLIFNPMNVSNLIMQNSYIILLSIGMCLCLVTGNFDLSAGSVVAVAGAILGIIVVRNGGSPVVAVIAALLSGALIGVMQGVIIAWIKVSPFIVTLAGMMTFRGVVMVLLNGQSLGPFPAELQYLAAGYISSDLRVGSLNIVALLAGILLCIAYSTNLLRSRANRKKYRLETDSLAMAIIKILVVSVVIMLIAYSLAEYKGLPFVLVIVGLAAVLYSYITSKTRIGRYLYALGGNEKAARLSGIRIERVKLLVFINMGIISALTGMLVTLRLNAAIPGAGNGFEMDAISACVIGGTSTAGGSGSVPGVIIGALVVAILVNGMSLLGMGTDAQQVIKGLVLLAAVTFDVVSKSRAGAKG
jgi:putative multiple sugar transport system permease protein